MQKRLFVGRSVLELLRPQCICKIHEVAELPALRGTRTRPRDRARGILHLWFTTGCLALVFSRRLARLCRQMSDVRALHDGSSDLSEKVGDTF